MKNYILLFALLISVFACKEDKATNEKEVKVVSKETSYATFGKKINDADALTANRMMEHYKSMKVGDTVNAKMRGEIVEVCSKKGCWMKINMGDDKIARVKFKDYAFFMPLNAKGEVVVNGRAFVTETSVADLKHYAEDAGKSTDEIAAITEPEVTYAFLADGVLLKK